MMDGPDLDFWMKADLWTFEEAVCIGEGYALIDNDLDAIKKYFAAQARVLSTHLLAERAIKTGSLEAKPICKEKPDDSLGYLIRPPTYLRWLKKVKGQLHPAFERFLEEHPESTDPTLNSDSAGRKDGNKSSRDESKGRKPGLAERYASKREEILGAALACLAAWPDDCRDKSRRVVADRLRILVEEKAPLFWPKEKEAPLSDRKICEILRKWLAMI